MLLVELILKVKLPPVHDMKKCGGSMASLYLKFGASERAVVSFVA